MHLDDLSLIAMTDGTSPGPAAEPQPQQSQQPEQPSSPAEETQEDDSDSSSGGCFKWVFGCGCLGIVGISLLSCIGFGVAMWTLPDTVGAEDWGEITELAETAQRLADQTGPAAQPGGDGIESMVRSGAEGQDDGEVIDQFFARLDEPVSTRDLRGHRSQLDDWEQADSVRRFNALINRFEELEERDESLFVGIEAVRVMFDMAATTNEMGQQFAGLGDDFHRVHAQSIAIARFSQFASGDHEPWEQDVADAMLEDHDEHREEFEEMRELLQRAAADDLDPDDLSAEEQQRLQQAQANQFLFMTAAINRDSLEAWAALSAEERKRIIEHANAPHNIISRVMGAAYVEEHDMYMMPLFGI